MAPPTALPIIFVLVLPLLYSLFAAPLFASSQNPDRNSPSLLVLVADLDGGAVGTALASFFHNASAAGSFTPNAGGAITFMPGYSVVSDVSEEELVRRVRDGDAWAAVYSTPGASSRLAAALASSGAAASYLSSAGPAGAIRFVWDEARNNMVSTGRVAAPTKQLLARFSATFAASQGLLPSVSGGAANFAVLANPASFTEVSLFPFTVPAVNQAVFVGQILLAVFSLVSVNVIFGPLALHPWVRGAAPGARLAAARLALCVLYAGAVAAAYAAILVGTAAVWNTAGVGAATFDGAMWAKVWATQWLRECCFFLAARARRHCARVPARAPSNLPNPQSRTTHTPRSHQTCCCT
jgi:hypothetical protein